MNELTAEDIATLREMERNLLGMGPAHAVAEGAIPDPVLRPGTNPNGLLGWIQSWTRLSGPFGKVVERIFPKVSLADHDAPTWIRLVHKMNPSWTRAMIGQKLGLPDWLVSIVLAMSCKRHRGHT